MLCLRKGDYMARKDGLTLIRLYRGYTGIMEKKMETTIGFRACLWLAGNEGMEKNGNY